MKQLLLSALEVAKAGKATYADARFMDEKNELVRIKNREVLEPTFSESSGVGIRVIVDGAWGFAATSDLTKKGVQKAAALAVKIARASAKLKTDDVRLTQEKAYVDKYVNPHQIDPFTVPMEQKIHHLMQASDILVKDPKVSVAFASMSFSKEHKIFASSEGAYIDQELFCSGCGISVTAIKDGDAQTRSYPMQFSANFESIGYEMVANSKLIENSERIRNEAVQLLSAKECPQGKMDLILGPEQLALQIHESCGHPTELDRVYGTEESYAGRSFMTTEKYKNFKYGSELVNLVADNTVAGGLATAAYDDDGVPAQKWHIVKDGMFVGYQTNREFAARLGEKRSTGNCRADGFTRIPIIRIANLYLEPGTWKLEDMIKDTKHGVMMDSIKSWSIDQLRYNFQFGCEIGYEIKDGKVVGMVKNANYQGITPEFWGNCNAICDRDDFKLVGVNNCGKGEPGQSARMSHGGPHTRFANVTVGVKT